MNHYVQNMDHCPESDEIINRATCNGCRYYKGFKVENAFPCVKCGYYDDVSDENTDE